ncbi:MAG: hypothetical protein AAF221_07035 [Pseudomonadota bacterium]
MNGEKNGVSEKARDLEKFYWFLIRIGALVFGVLMVVAGALTALTFASEKLRTGAVAFGGAEHADTMAAIKAIGVPTLIALLGAAMVRFVRRRQATADAD